MTPIEAQQYCTALTKKSGSNFYYSFLFLPRRRREAMYTVYAFCKEVDNAVDEPPPGSNPQQELQTMAGRTCRRLPRHADLAGYSEFGRARPNNSLFLRPTSRS